MDILHPLPEHPWAGLAIGAACGRDEDDGGAAGRTGKTPVIPRSVQRTLFAYCEARLDEMSDMVSWPSDHWLEWFLTRMLSITQFELFPRFWNPMAVAPWPRFVVEAWL
jgi:hypothetical protein